MTRALFIFLIMGIGGRSALQAQKVFDASVVSALVITHRQTQESLKEIKNNEGKLSGMQTLMARQMEEIKTIEEHLFHRLDQVNGLITTGKDLLYATTLVQHIGVYQKEMVDLAREDATLALVAARTELALLKRTKHLVLYLSITLFTQEGSFVLPLMDPGKRMALTRHVLDELRLMRGMAYGVVRRMRVARRASHLQQLLGTAGAFPDRGGDHVRQLLQQQGW
ncbi:hypothetical protein SAMN05421823_11569 [Catalinimonas alkaloidigena]|uniref:Uncharacterized protein n=1 Tax=Catalinimonas alkaloidigena TaxID=1075417 RepID=A0A1G9U348_9BACT|nr:hypothetical protein [Catalinimonas alkaloidigena]SDM54263.1 hypothetical protein SAMN05421823_11569 [Catalinimonas alkaloidigena]